MDRSLRFGRLEVEITYSPLQSQLKFRKSNARFVGFSGPIGSGKSQALVHEAIRCSYQNQGRWGLLGAPTYQMLRDATQKALFEVLEEERTRFTFHKSENTLRIDDTGSKILFRSMDEYERLRGMNLAWFGIDELTYTHQEAWLRLEGRLRDPKAKLLRGFAVWTPKGFDWVYRKFIQDETGNYDVIRAEAFENTHLLKAVPDFYDRLRKSYDPEFYEQEVLGSYLSLNGGLVYRCFSRAEHVQELEVDARKPLLWALDFNVDPMSSVVVQLARDVAYVLDEVVVSRATTEMACEEFASRYINHPGGLRIYGDASGHNTHTTGSTDYGIIQDFFRRRRGSAPEQRVPRVNPLVRDRVSLVNARLRNADGEIRLRIDPRCKELIKDFEELAFKEGTMIPDKDKDPKRSHLSDALGYLLWQEFHTGKAGERSGRLF